MADRSKLKRKANFLKLMEDAEYYFGKGVRLTLFPNGEREIWITNASGTHGMRITASVGKAGLGLRIGHFVGTVPITLTGNKHKTYDVLKQVDMNEVSLCQYNLDPESQRFKDWYGRDRDEEPEYVI